MGQHTTQVLHLKTAGSIAITPIILYVLYLLGGAVFDMISATRWLSPIRIRTSNRGAISWLRKKLSDPFTFRCQKPTKGTLCPHYDRGMLQFACRD